MKAWKVKIIDSAGANRWYSDKIGQELWVEPFQSPNASEGQWHKIIGPDDARTYIERQDFEILREAEVRIEMVAKIVELPG
jgi:hypothetical protein